MPKLILREWGVVDDQDPWQAPEQRQIYLVGKVYGHLDHPNGTKIQTSAIVEIRGRKIGTYAGNVYELKGLPCSSYRAWMKEHGFKYNPSAPIKSVKTPVGISNNKIERENTLIIIANCSNGT